MNDCTHREDVALICVGGVCVWYVYNVGVVCLHYESCLFSLEDILEIFKRVELKWAKGKFIKQLLLQSWTSNLTLFLSTYIHASSNVFVQYVLGKRKLGDISIK